MTTNLTEPTAGNSKLVAPLPSERKVKVRALMPFALTRAGKVYEPGEETEVTETEAKELCDTVVKGTYAFSGERMGHGSDDRHTSRKAERVK